MSETFFSVPPSATPCLHGRSIGGIAEMNSFHMLMHRTTSVYEFLGLIILSTQVQPASRARISSVYYALSELSINTTGSPLTTLIFKSPFLSVVYTLEEMTSLTFVFAFQPVWADLRV